MSEDVHPESGTTTYAVNAGGQVTSRTDARSKVTNYTYDAIGRIDTISYRDSTPDVDYTYDQSGYTGFLTAVDVDGVTASTFQYSNAGLLTQEVVTLDGVTGTFASGYSYDLDGRLLAVTYPNGRVVTRVYDYGSALAESWPVILLVDFVLDVRAPGGLSLLSISCSTACWANVISFVRLH